MLLNVNSFEGSDLLRPFCCQDGIVIVLMNLVNDNGWTIFTAFDLTKSGLCVPTIKRVAQRHPYQGSALQTPLARDRFMQLSHLRRMKQLGHRALS